MSRGTMVVAIAAAACGSGAAAPDASPACPDSAAAVAPKYFADCPDWGCGRNAATIAGHRFHELDGSGQRDNRAGIRVVAFRAMDGGELELAVDRDILRGRRRSDGSVLEGAALVGSVITLMRGNDEYRLRLAGYDCTDFWVERTPDGAAPVCPTAPDGKRRVPYYDFVVTMPGWPDSQAVPLCPTTPDSDDLEIGLRGKALFFTGDRFRVEGIKVEETLDDDPSGERWFNVACAATAPAKLHLLGYTRASQQAGRFTTARAEREALIKMLSADYCGDGYSFTVDGVPLRYLDAKGWYVPASGAPDPSDRATIEAVWTLGGGARCLDVPRHARREDVAARCALPRCTDAELSDWSGAGVALTAGAPACSR